VMDEDDMLVRLVLSIDRREDTAAAMETVRAWGTSRWDGCC
jgi:hypothetical protein